MKKYKYIFGPVPSRRLGRSLGIDLTPLKVCTEDCTYCQLGQTTQKTLVRKEWVPTADVLDELKTRAREQESIDHITISGSGEPTLHVGLGEILSFIKDNFQAPSVVLSNGSLFYLPEVRQAVTKADIVKATLSSWDNESFEKIHRPATPLTFDRFWEGLRALRKEFSGQLWLEVMVLNGYNSTPEVMSKISNLANVLTPDRIDLNTTIRPPAENSAQCATLKQLEELRNLFGKLAYIATDFKSTNQQKYKIDIDMLESLLRRHCASTDEISKVFNVSLEQTIDCLHQLQKKRIVSAVQRNNRTYYGATEDEKTTT